MNVDARLINDIANVGYFSAYAYLKWLKPIRFGKRFAIILSTETGTVYGDSVAIPISYQFYIGGAGFDYYRGEIPFLGLDYLEKRNESFWKARLDLRLRILKKFFITAKLNVGQTSDKLFANIEKSDILYGGGLSFSYKSIIGPIEFCFIPRLYSGPIYYFSLGYQF
jgi:NTE family protein